MYSNSLPKLASLCDTVEPLWLVSTGEFAAKKPKAKYSQEKFKFPVKKV